MTSSSSVTVVGIVVLFCFGITSCLEWETGPGAVVRACLGKNATFPWGFRTGDKEDVVDIHWVFQGPSTTETPLASFAHNRGFMPNPVYSSRLCHLPNGGLSLRDVTEADSGKYGVEVNLLDKYGCYTSHRQSTYLHVADRPALRVEQSPQAFWDKESGWVIRLSCGRFHFKEQPPLHAFWTTPTEETKSSTGYNNGSFYLTLSSPVVGGNYTCHVPAHLLSHVCDVDTQRSAHDVIKGQVLVDEHEARVSLMQAELSGVKQESRQLREELDGLKQRHSDEMTTLIYHMEEKYTQLTQYVDRQNAGLTQYVDRQNAELTQYVDGQKAEGTRNTDHTADNCCLNDLFTRLQIEHQELKEELQMMEKRQSDEVGNLTHYMHVLKADLTQRIGHVEDNQRSVNHSINGLMTQLQTQNQILEEELRMPGRRLSDDVTNLTDYLEEKNTRLMQYVDQQKAELTEKIDYVVDVQRSDNLSINGLVLQLQREDGILKEELKMVGQRHIDEMSNLTYHVEKHNTELTHYVDGQNADLTQYVDRQNANVTQYVDGQNADLKHYVDGQNANLTQYVDEQNADLTHYVDGQNADLTQYVDGQNADLTQYVDGQNATLMQCIKRQKENFREITEGVENTHRSYNLSINDLTTGLQREDQLLREELKRVEKRHGDDVANLTHYVDGRNAELMEKIDHVQDTQQSENVNVTGLITHLQTKDRLSKEDLEMVVKECKDEITNLTNHIEEKYTQLNQYVEEQLAGLMTKIEQIKDSHHSDNISVNHLLTRQQSELLQLIYSINDTCPCCLQPCENGGRCEEDGDGYTCHCPSGFTGHHCQHTQFNGSWATWGSYGSCSQTCGGGTQQRERTCTDPAPTYGGADCSGPSQESRSCNNQTCPVNGSWATWGSYGSCSQTCGGGTQQRERTCTDPAPAHGGADCSGPSQDSRSCNSHTCPDPCSNSTHTVSDDDRRSIYYRIQQIINDQRLRAGWYRFLLSGKSAFIPTICPPDHSCGADVQVWVDLQGEAMPGVGEEVTAQAYGQDTMNCKRYKESLVTIRNCGSFFVYHLQPIVTSPWRAGYCVTTSVYYL